MTNRADPLPIARTALVAGIIFFLAAMGDPARAANLTTSEKIINHADLLSGLDANDQFGASVTTGDVNGDGILDYIIGARLDDDGGSERGAVYVLFRDASGEISGEYKISDPGG